jgi:hypothetical protein
MTGVVAKKTEKRQSVTEIIETLDPDVKLACPDWLIAELISKPIHLQTDSETSMNHPVEGTHV